MQQAQQAAEASDRGDYWQRYYSAQSGARLPVPSQFSVFVASELDGRHRIFDIGCGGGRDSLLFASHGHRVTGIDGSAAAVEVCREVANGLSVPADFMHASVSDPGLPGKLLDGDEAPVLVYARFFLHAITEEEEGKFLALAAALLANGGRLAVEFRTMRDADQAKITGSHYRRFIDPLQFMARAAAAGFHAHYFVEGFGFAKYKKDDAHVARFIFGVLRT